MVEWNATQYSQHSSLQSAIADEQIARLWFAGTERVLDVGCGDGRVTARMAAMVPRGSVLGIDPSANMIAFAKENRVTQTTPNLNFEVGDVRHLRFREEFDTIVSFNALHWVPEQSQALSALHAALIEKGKAYLRFVGEGPRRSLEDVIEDARQSGRWACHFKGFARPFVHPLPEPYRQLATSCGFRVLKMTLEDRIWDFKTRESFVAFAQGTSVAWTGRLPESEVLPFIEDVLDRYRAFVGSGRADANAFKFYQLVVEMERS